MGKVRRVLAWGAALVGVAVVGLVLFVAGRSPSNDREWNPDQERTPWAEIDGDTAVVHEVRNFAWKSEEAYEPRWETRAYDLSRIQTVWFVVEPFSSFAGAAHTFISFGFEGGEYVAVSVEIRKEVGESYDPFLGLLRQYELMYVIGDERDLIGLRTNHRHDDVFVYPMKASPEAVRALFVDVLERATALRSEPAFYNTLTANCTTAIVDHVNALAPETVPYGRKVLFPGYSDELAWELGLIDTTLPLEQLREHFRVNDAAARFAGASDFSIRIREH